jgi:hypothetical protein
MDVICVSAGICIDVAKRMVHFCPGCMLEALGEPVTLENVTAALVSAMAWLHRRHGISVAGFNYHKAALDYLRNPCHDHA